MSFITTAAKVTIEFKKVAGPAELLAAAREVVAILEAEQGSGSEAA